MATASETFYAEMADVATDLLSSEQMGGTVTFKRYSGGSTDPITGEVTAGTSTEFSPNGVIKEYDDSLIDGTRIIVGDKLAVIDAATYAPAPSDKIIIGSEEWSVVGIKKKDLVGVPIAYMVQARR